MKTCNEIASWWGVVLTYIHSSTLVFNETNMFLWISNYIFYFFVQLHFQYWVLGNILKLVCWKFVLDNLHLLFKIQSSWVAECSELFFFLKTTSDEERSHMFSWSSCFFVCVGVSFSNFSYKPNFISKHLIVSAWIWCSWTAIEAWNVTSLCSTDVKIYWLSF